MWMSPREAGRALDAFFLGALHQSPGAFDQLDEGYDMPEDYDLPNDYVSDEEGSLQYPEFDYREDGNFKVLLKQFNGNEAMAKYWYDRHKSNH